MSIDIIYIMLSLCICGAILYITAMLWFCNAHTRQLKSFIGFGISSFFWTLCSALTAICKPEHFIFMYAVHSVSACVFPYVFCWFALCYTDSKLTRIPAFISLLIALPLVDSVLLATNPWHFLVIKSYEGLLTGPLFWLHAVFAYAVTLLGLSHLAWYVIRSPKRSPATIIAGISSCFPFIINLLLALDMLGTREDWTPIGFFVTFTLFYLATYKTDLFNFKSIALSGIFTSLTDIIVIVNARGVVVDMNDAFVRAFPEVPITPGETPFSLFKAWLSICITETEPQNLLQMLDNAKGGSVRGEITLETMRGEGETVIRTYSLRKEFINRRSGASGWVVTMSDVSEYRSMIREINAQNTHLAELADLAKQASYAKSAFLANMSHEIRTPINAITGMATIARNTSDPFKVIDCLDKMDAASRQLLGIINDILDMSKIEANKMELAHEPFELYAAIYNIRSIISVRTAEKSQMFRVDIAEDVPRVVVGDEMRLAQILLNLLSNATKFTPNGGCVELCVRLIGTEDEKHCIEATVRDSGIGITEEQMKRLFHAFEQAENSTSKRFGGTGLGLVISKSIAELMGGGIEVASRLGEGSIFTVRVQLAVGTADMLKKTVALPSYDFRGRTALLAEDIDINREIVLAILADSGITIDCAEDGKRAVELYSADPERYDIIFMDVHMPVMDGYAATQAIRASNTNNAGTIPIVAMTANVFAEDVEQCRLVGMNDHIAKPLDVDVLFAKLAEHLANQA